MSDNRHLSTTYATADYNSLAAAINYEYCKKYNYDFLYYRPYLMHKDQHSILNCKNPVTRRLRHASWAKLLSTLHVAQEKYDYIVYIDSDCIFKDFEKSIEEFIGPYAKNDIVFLNSKPWGDHLPCAGFYICKVNDYTKQFLRDWYNVNIPDKDVHHAWEQDALWGIFNRYNIGIVDSWMFREEEGQFLRHVPHCEAANRMPYFSSFIQLHNINYTKNISEINVVEFDTTIY